MGIKRGTEKTPIDTLRINAFSGGMNTSASPRDIEPNEASLIENLEFDDLDNLVTRNGNSNSTASESGFTGSVFSFNTESGHIGVLWTPGTALLSLQYPGVLSNTLTGALVLPDGAKWYWKSLANVAVGVNGTTGANNPIQVVGPAPGTASHLAAAPDGRYIEEWGSRLWIVHVSNPNRIQCSDLGTAVTWNTGGFTNPVQGIILDVAAGDGDRITGIFPFKERLFIFKRRKIYVLRITADPETDPKNWELVEYSKNIGCINQDTIAEVFDDVVFLSEGGLCSLSASEGTADFASTLISQKISEIQRIKKDAPETDIVGFSLVDRSQYWLAVAANSSPTGSNIIWVMDYKQIRTKGVRWTTFTGGLFPTCIDVVRSNERETTYVIGITTATNPTTSSIGIYKPNVPILDRVFTDFSPNATPIIQRINTKAFDFGLDEIRKLLQQWYLRFDTISNNAKFRISYEQDDPTQPIVNYDFNTVGKFGPIEQLVRQSFFHGVSRKVVSVRFLIRVGGINNQGVSIKNFGIRYAVLSERRSEMLISTLLKNVYVCLERNRTSTPNNAGILTDLHSYTLPFDSLRTNGDLLRVTYGLTLATNDNDKRIELVFGGSTYFNSALIDIDAGSVKIVADFIRISPTSLEANVMILEGQIQAIGGAVNIVAGNGAWHEGRTVNVASSDLNQFDVILKVRAQGVANNDIIQTLSIIEINQQ